MVDVSAVLLFLITFSGLLQNYWFYFQGTIGSDLLLGWTWGPIRLHAGQPKQTRLLDKKFWVNKNNPNHFTPASTETTTATRADAAVIYRRIVISVFLNAIFNILCSGSFLITIFIIITLINYFLIPSQTLLMFFLLLCARSISGSVSHVRMLSTLLCFNSQILMSFCLVVAWPDCL